MVKSIITKWLIAFLSNIARGAYHVKILYHLFLSWLFFGISFSGDLMRQLLYGAMSLSGYTRISRDVWVRLGAQSNKDLKVTGRNANTKYWMKNK